MSEAKPSIPTEPRRVEVTLSEGGDHPAWLRVRLAYMPPGTYVVARKPDGTELRIQED
jgi:hypothetical protein